MKRLLSIGLFLSYIILSNFYAQEKKPNKNIRKDFITYDNDSIVSNKIDSTSIDEESNKGYENLSSKAGVVTGGLGFGLPYGGIGARLGVNFKDYLNLFAGVGTQLAGLGYNFGFRFDFKSKNLLK